MYVVRVHQADSDVPKQGSVLRLQLVLFLLKSTIKDPC